MSLYCILKDKFFVLRVSERVCKVLFSGTNVEVIQVEDVIVTNKLEGAEMKEIGHDNRGL